MVRKLYKVMNDEELFWNGRKNFKFDKKGKIFTEFKDLLTALKRLDIIEDEWKIVEFEILPLTAKIGNVKETLDKIQRKDDNGS